MHVREEPQRHALVGHAVLQAQDRYVGRCHRGQLLERRRRLMRLRCQQRDVVPVPVDCGGIVDDGHVERHLAVRVLETQAVTRQRLEVGPAGNQHRRVAVLVQPATDGTSDRACTDHDVTHSPSISGRGPDMPIVRSR